MLAPMQPRRNFGLRPREHRDVRRDPPPVARAAPPPSATEEALQAAAEQLDLYAVDAEVGHDVKAWKADRKRAKRSFREPWRSVSIAAGIGFGLSAWLLPDSVADVMQVVTLGLSAAAVYAGLRRKPEPPENPPPSEW